MSKPSLTKVISKEYNTLNSARHQVLVEGRFLEINHSGKAVDQVWLGLTRTELVISDIESEDKKTEAGVKPAEESRKETDESTKILRRNGQNNLRLRKTLPMKFIRILVIDDRAKRMAVTTSTSSITFYEMCKPKDDWGRWKHAAAKLHQKHNKYRRRLSRTEAFNTTETAVSPKNEASADASKYITYPFICRQISDRGVQTDPLPEPPAPPVTENQPIITYLDELDPIVVQEYQVALDRVSFLYRDEIIVLCKTVRYVGCCRSNSSTCLKDRKSVKYPQKSVSCPSLWNPPLSIKTMKSSKSSERHFARRKLKKDEADTVDQMLEYRQKQQKHPQVKGEWNTNFTWNWEDGSGETLVDLQKLLEDVKDEIGSSLEEPLFESTKEPCPHCGERKPESVDKQETSEQGDSYLNISNADVREFHAGEIAMQLTLRDRNLLWLLTQTDITKLALCTLPNSVQNTNCTVVQKMAAWSERLSRLVATEVLDQPTYENCLESLKLFIKVAEFCWVIRNFNSFVNVMRGLQFYPVYRLGVVWEYLQKSDPKLCELYLTMCDKMILLMTNLRKSGPKVKRLPIKCATIPWFPALICRLINETLHLQAIRLPEKEKGKKLTEEMLKLSNQESLRVQARAAMETAPWLQEYAHDSSTDIIKEAISQSTWQIFDSGSSGAESADEAVDELDAQAFENLNHPPRPVSEEMDTNKTVFQKIKSRVLNAVNDDDGKTSKLDKALKITGIKREKLDAVQNRVTKFLPEALRPKPPPEPRELSLLEKLSGKTEPEPEPPKSVLKKMKEAVTGEEDVKESPMPQLPKPVDKDMDELLEQLNAEEAAEPKDTVHVVANKKRTPKIVRFFGKFMKKDSKATKSMGGVAYEPTKADRALMSHPSPGALDRGKTRFSKAQNKGQSAAGLNAQNETKNMTRRKSLLASSDAFSEINNKFKNGNKNANAKGTSEIIDKIVALGRPLSYSRRFCSVCLSLACPYRGDPARYLLEVQLAADKYKYIHNSQADAFLTRRPVLAEYLLLDSFRQGLA